MKMENVEGINFEKREDVEKFMFGDRVEHNSREGKVVRVAPNLPEGLVGIEFEDTKKEEVVSEKDVNKIEKSAEKEE